MGRPPLPPEKRKRPSMGFRPTAALRKKLEHEAASSGLSLTQEVERRLERSFGEEENLRWAFSQMFRDEALFQILHSVASVIRLIEKQRGKPWHQDPNTRHEAVLCFRDYLDAEAERASEGAPSQDAGSSSTGRMARRSASRLRPRQSPTRGKAK